MASSRSVGERERRGKEEGDGSLSTQAQLEENDGIVDMQCSHEDYPTHCTNLDLLLRSMATFFSW